MATVTFGKDAAEIMKRGGFLYLTPYTSTKDIDRNLITYASADVIVGATQILALFGLGAPASGTLTINGETKAYTLTGKTFVVTAMTGAVSKGDEITIISDAAYSTYGCVGHSEQSVFNAGNPEETYIVNEIEENVGAFADSAAAPMFTHRCLQSAIDNIALACGKDVESSTENGATVISGTKLTDYAGIYVARRLTSQGGYKYYVIKFPHLKISTSPDVTFSPSEKTILEYSFKVLFDNVADYDYKILEVG